MKYGMESETTFHLAGGICRMQNAERRTRRLYFRSAVIPELGLGLGLGLVRVRVG